MCQQVRVDVAAGRRCISSAHPWLHLCVHQVLCPRLMPSAHIRRTRATARSIQQPVRKALVQQMHTVVALVEQYAPARQRRPLLTHSHRLQQAQRRRLTRSQQDVDERRRLLNHSIKRRHVCLVDAARANLKLAPQQTEQLGVGGSGAQLAGLKAPEPLLPSRLQRVQDQLLWPRGDNHAQLHTLQPPQLQQHVKHLADASRLVQPIKEQHNTLAHGSNERHVEQHVCHAGRVRKRLQRLILYRQQRLGESLESKAAVARASNGKLVRE